MVYPAAYAEREESLVRPRAAIPVDPKAIKIAHSLPKMTKSKVIAPANFTLMPWKNGKGETTELYCMRQPGIDAFLWRLSIASVIEDGPFSTFSGYDRTLVMIAGSGMELIHEGQATQLLKDQYDLCSFDGGYSTSARLLNGPIRDFNIICNAQFCQAKVSILMDHENTCIRSAADDLFIYADKSMGLCSQASAANEIEIPKGHLFHANNIDIIDMNVSGEGLICVEIFAR